MGKKRSREQDPSTSSSDSSSSSSSSSSSEDEKERKKRHKHKKEQKKKKSKKKHKHKNKKHHKKKRKGLSETGEEEVGLKRHALPSAAAATTTTTSSSSKLTTAATEHVVAAKVAKPKAPMSLAEYQAEQSVVREVYDAESGRMRLVRGSGEILERIVSRDQQRDINRRATYMDGVTFQSSLLGGMPPRR